MLVTDRRRCAGNLVTAVEDAVRCRRRRQTSCSCGRRIRAAGGPPAPRAPASGRDGRPRPAAREDDRVERRELYGADGVRPGGAGGARGRRPLARAGRDAGRGTRRSTTLRSRPGGLDGAGYLVSELSPSRSHPGAPAGGLALLDGSSRVSLPVVGIGGIGPEEAAACRQRGAAGVAVIDAILAAPNTAHGRGGNPDGAGCMPGLTPGHGTRSTRRLLFAIVSRLIYRSPAGAGTRRSGGELTAGLASQSWTAVPRRGRFMQCARHPRTETYVRCSKCDTPICGDTMVTGPVGIRCRKCSQPSSSPLFKPQPTSLIRAGAGGLPFGLRPRGHPELSSG